jgi:ketosteroid isomerase-like protein
MMKILVGTVACLAASALIADPGDDVRCREIGFSQSTENRDIQAFRSFIDADARFVSNEVLRGVDAVAEAWAVFFTNPGPTIRWRPEVIEVLENGTLALSRGPYRVVSQDADGNVVESWGTFNSVWRVNDDGQWRVVFDAGNPAASAPDEKTKALLAADDDC